MDMANLVKRVDELLDLGNATIATVRSVGGRNAVECVDAAPMAAFRTAVLSFIERIFGSTHPHFRQFSERTRTNQLVEAKQGIAILEAIRSEIAGGWLSSLKGLIAAELFSDFLDMADHLLESGYKDAAAVIAGSVLEEHLRQLCIKSSIPIEERRDDRMVPHKADRLNAQLVSAQVYGKLDQKLVTAWLDLRNNAAHGGDQAYNSEQVARCLAGVTEFLARVSL